MKTTVILSALFLTFCLNSVKAQRTENHQVPFSNMDGFSGEVTLRVVFDYNFEPYVKTKPISGVITSYKNHQYDDILREAGIVFPIQMGEKQFFTASATFVLYSTQNLVIESVSDNLMIDGWPKFPPFSKKTKEFLENSGEDKSIVGKAMSGGEEYWRRHGAIKNIKVNELYLTDLRNKIENAIREHENKLKQAKQEEAARKEKEEQAQKEKLAGIQKGQGYTSSGFESSSGSFSSPSTVLPERPGYSEVDARIEEARRKKEEDIREMNRKIAEYNAERRRIEEGSQRMQSGLGAMAADMASGSTQSNGLLAGSQEFIQGVAETTNSEGATIGAGVVAVGLSILSSAQKEREAREAREEQRRLEEARKRQQEEERMRREQEIAAQRQEALDLLISQRRLILETYGEHTPLPLSSDPVKSKTIYYFIYAYDPAFLKRKSAKIVVSNLFAISRYNDGTWPYQSKIDAEIADLTTYDEVLNGYYTDKDYALKMRKEFIENLKNNEGVQVIDIKYREDSVSELDSVGEANDTVTDSDATGKRSGLGISISPAKEKSNSDDEVKKSPEKTNALGIPIKM